MSGSLLDRKRLDLFAECNAGGAPVDEWKEIFCNHCINPECSRSLFGQSKFDLRVNTWQERLFTNVPTMAPDDPRFGEISAQKFMEMAAGGPLEVRDWAEVPTEATQKVNPVSGLARPPVKEELPAPAPEPPTPEPEPELVVQEPAPTWKDPEPVVTPESPTSAPAPKPKPQRAPSRQGLLANTPAQSKMLPGAPKKSAPQADPWAAPIPTKIEGEVVVEPGARVKVGKH